MAQDSTRSLSDIINELRADADQWPESRDPSEAPRLLVEALTEIDRRLAALESAQGNPFSFWGGQRRPGE